jgi:hypothetical protein
VWVDVISCTKSLGDPHNSKTVPGEVVAKGKLECLKSPRDAIYAKATITLFYSTSASGPFYIVSQRDATGALNVPGRVKIPDYKLAAAARCQEGWYYSTLNVAYYAPSGNLLAYQNPIRSQNTKQIRC